MQRSTFVWSQECHLLGISPFPWLVILGRYREWFGNNVENLHNFFVIIGKVKEWMYPMYVNSFYIFEQNIVSNNEIVSYATLFGCALGVFSQLWLKMMMSSMSHLTNGNLTKFYPLPFGTQQVHFLAKKPSINKFYPFWIHQCPQHAVLCLSFACITNWW